MSEIPLFAPRLPTRATGWVVATAIGTAIAFPIFFYPPSGDGLLQALAILGVFVGPAVLQWYVLMQHRSHGATWRSLPVFILVAAVAAIALMLVAAMLGDSDVFLVVWFAYLGIVLGATMGALRWFLSLRGMRATPWWILLESGSWAIALALGRIAPEVVGIVRGWEAGPILGGVASPGQAYDLFFPVVGASSGAVVALIEWPAFRRLRLCTFPNWIASNVSGWAAGWTIARLGVGPALGLRGGLVAGAVAGTITGAVLMRGFRMASVQANQSIDADSQHPGVPINGA